MSADAVRAELDHSLNMLTLRPKPSSSAVVAIVPLNRLSTIWADDIVLNLATSGLVNGLIPATGMTVLYGESNTGKTFVTIDIACHIAAGMSWRGRDVEQGVVLYIAAEAPESVKRRIWAWKAHYGVEHLPVLIVQSCVDLLQGDTEAIVKLVTDVAQVRGRMALVVVDTLARSMVGNENSPEDMGAFVAACAAIREAANTHVLVVHHCGKDTARGARGHSCLRAATDVELEVEAGSIRLTKSRDEASNGVFGFRLEAVEMGTDPKGRTVTTCIAVEATAPLATTKSKALGANERIALDALSAAIADHGAPPPYEPDIPRHVRGVPIERWQDYASRYLPQKDSKRKHEGFARASISLVAKKIACHVKGFAWLP